MTKADKINGLIETALRYDAMFEELLKQKHYEQAVAVLNYAVSCRRAALAIQAEPEPTPPPLETETP